MGELEKEFKQDVRNLVDTVDAVYDDADMYLEDRVKAIDAATKKFKDKWGDYETAEKTQKASLKGMIGNREPVVETKEGPIYFQISSDGKRMEYGGVCNTGLLVDGSVEYDFQHPAEWNLFELVNAIYEKYGAFDDDEEN